MTTKHEVLTEHLQEWLAFKQNRPKWSEPKFFVFPFWCGWEESNSTTSVPQLAGLIRFALNPAQSGFDSSRNLLLAGYFTPPCTNKITTPWGGYFIEQCGW